MLLSVFNTSISHSNVGTAEDVVGYLTIYSDRLCLFAEFVSERILKIC